MLLLFFFVHILLKNSSLVQGSILHSRAPVNSCDDINSCRRLFDIVWGCLTTIFACTWVSVHPNVPPPDQGRVALFWRRLKMMLIAVIAPELMVGFAARQLWAARKFSKEFKKKKFLIKLTHGFFISMGGFVSRNGHPIVTIKQLTDNSAYMSAIHDVKAEDISDKGNSDTFSKGIALLQGLWFVTQCLARLHQHLSVTQLEVATLAFAVVNVLIWALWWAKPLDVEQLILVGSTVELEGAERTIWSLHLWDRFSGIFNGNYSPYVPIASTSVPIFWSMDLGEASSTEQDIPFYIECLIGTIFGVIHCAAWNVDFPSTIEMHMWRTCSLMVTTTPLVFALVAVLYEPTTTGSVGSFGTIFGILFAVSLPLYLIARLFLITIPFTSLRALPPGAFIDVNWSVYIPHL
ncbi:hypothetical protein C8R44DRAFT_731980 [Mycena epipterygia]|nr:hypothetical protein C8R44DRAFT_731980 [Mycena epipterygia]